MQTTLHLAWQELELRLETQKQTLLARDESIKKLLEMLQNKGMGEQYIFLYYTYLISQRENRVYDKEIFYWWAAFG